MTWFKVDDQFYNHPKVLTLDMASRGLWVSAGAYCASYLTDGVITDKQIRAIGGTRKQAEKLVAAGLWSADDAPPSARRYAFNDWRDFQPTRDDVLSRRQRARDRMAEARAKKRTTSDNAEMFARTEGERSQSVRIARQFAERSHYPDPTRPDPTRPNSGGEVASQPYGPNAREELAGGESPFDELADATRRARQAGIPEAAIAEGTRRFHTKPGQKGPGLLRTLIDEAARDLETQNQVEEKRSQHRAAIDACPWCDERGMLEGTHPDGTAWAMKCTHPDDMPQMPEPPQRQRHNPPPDAATDFLARLETRAAGGPF